MIDYSYFFEYISRTKLSNFSGSLQEAINSEFINSDINKWETALQKFPGVTPSVIDITKPTIEIGKTVDCSNEEKESLKNLLMQFHPWRKGPYNIFGNFIDTEWRSDWKWARLEGSVSPLEGRDVLDVGCGNGYHCLRMLGEGANAVTGIDPYLLSIYQFQAVIHYMQEVPVWVLPLKMEQFPKETKFFDTVFSMGVLYHRRSPFAHLYELKGALKSGGELVLETLVIDGKAGEVLVPEGRYAKMRNVWFIPSLLTLESWLKRSGFKNIRHINTTATNLEEQRRTEWMEYESLRDFLNPSDNSKTIEGHPAPMRTIFVAEIN